MTHIHCCACCRFWAEMSNDEGECCRLDEDHPEMKSTMQRTFVREIVASTLEWSDRQYPMVSHVPMSKAAQSMMIPGLITKAEFYCADFLHKDGEGGNCPQSLD